MPIQRVVPGPLIREAWEASRRSRRLSQQSIRTKPGPPFWLTDVRSGKNFQCGLPKPPFRLVRVVSPAHDIPQQPRAHIPPCQAELSMQPQVGRCNVGNVSPSVELLKRRMGIP